ncbi:hypothetical protein Tco_1155795 [Tanacetum coccineum]
MCNDSWGRSSFARCLIEVNSEVDLMDVVTIGIPSLSEDDFTKETIHVEYEWRPPRCDTCKTFGHVHDYCPKKVKKRKGKSKSTNGGQFTGPLVKHNVKFVCQLIESYHRTVKGNQGLDSKWLIEADLVVDDENILIETEIQDVDDIDVDKDAEENFAATLGLLKIDVNQLNETKLVDVQVLDAAIQAVDSEIQVMDEVVLLKSLKRKRVVRWLRLEMVQECDNVAKYKVLCSLENGDSRKVHCEALEKQYNTTCVKKKHKEIWREVEVQVPKPPSWTPENVIEDIDLVEQATNAS